MKELVEQILQIICPWYNGSTFVIHHLSHGASQICTLLCSVSIKNLIITLHSVELD